MVNENFDSVTELYMRVLPALRLKKKELKIENLGFITEKDIWDCLTKKEWSNQSDLTLHDIVDSILHLKEEVILEYMNSVL